MRLCSLEDCDSKHFAKNYCKKHYTKLILSQTEKYKETMRRVSKNWRKRNPSKSRESKKEYSKTIKARFYYGKRTAKRRNKSWTIEFKDYKNLIVKKCVYCKEYENEGTGVGLDRIDNNKDYHINNVVRCCGECNGFRSNKITHEELLIAYAAIFKHRNKNVQTF